MQVISASDMFNDPKISIGEDRDIGLLGTVASKVTGNCLKIGAKTS
jgi:hypothetical protein